jgi:methyl-accepting chemotaxis protein
MDVILLPIGEGNRIRDQVAHGKVSELITETYQGDHERMKQNVNNIALVLQRFQAELSQADRPQSQGAA